MKGKVTALQESLFQHQLFPLIPHSNCMSMQVPLGTERIHGGVEVLEQEEGGDDDEHQEEGVVVEDGEGCGFVIGHFVLLPQDPWQKRAGWRISIDLTHTLISIQ